MRLNAALHLSGRVGGLTSSIGVRVANGFPSTPIAGLKRHVRTASTARLEDASSILLTTAMSVTTPCSVMVARRTTSPCKCRTRACVQERVAGTKHVAHAGYLKTGKLLLSLLAMITTTESSGPALNRRGSSSLSGVERGTLILNSSIVLRLMVST